MKFCPNCGSSCEDDVYFCASCGSSLETNGYEPVSENPYDLESDPSETPPVTADESFNADAPVAPAEEEKKSKSKKGPAEFVNKKWNLLSNIAVCVCSLVFILVALLGPIKVMGYFGEKEIMNDMENMRDYPFASVDEDENSTTFSYFDYNQSIWDMVGAIKYFSFAMDSESDAESYQELVKDYTEARAKAAVEFAQWMANNPGASEAEAYNAYLECKADALSDCNYMALMLAGTQMIKTDDVNFDYYIAIISVAIGLILAILSAVLAIVSLVYLIKGGVAMVKKKDENLLTKFLGIAIGISGSGVSLLMASPTFKAGGAMVGILATACSVYFVYALVKSLFIDKTGILELVKKAVVCGLIIISLFLLCTNIFCYKHAFGDRYEAKNVPVGYGIYSIFDFVENMMASGGEEVAASSALSEVGAYLTGSILYMMVIGFVYGMLLKALKRALKLFAGEPCEKNINASLIVAFVFAVVAIVCGMVLCDVFTKIFAKMIQEGWEPNPDEKVSWLFNAQFWITAILTLGAVLVNILLKSKPKEEKLEEEKPVEAPSDGELIA